MDPRQTAPSPLVVLDRVRAADRAGPRGRARGRLDGISLALGPGVFAVVGRPEDGTYALHEVLSGRARPSSGRVLVGGRSPSRDASVRARLGALGPEPVLPEARRISEAVELALEARGEPRARAASVLEILDLAPLGGRPASGLSFAEARAVELALALSSRSPLLLLLHEPLAETTPARAEQVAARLREAAASGACVFVTTSSEHEADELDAEIRFLQLGRLHGDPGPGLPGQELEVIVEPAPGDPPPVALRALAAALTARPEVSAVRWQIEPTSGASLLRLTGPDLEACAVALAEIATAAGVALGSIALLPRGARLQPRRRAAALPEQVRPEPAPTPGPEDGAPSGNLGGDLGAGSPGGAAPPGSPG